MAIGCEMRVRVEEGTEDGVRGRGISTESTDGEMGFVGIWRSPGTPFLGGGRRCELGIGSW